MTFTKRSERGFTVIELLTVVAIMLVITAIATPSFYYWLPKYRLSAGARQIAAELQLARMKAISQNTKYRLRFTFTNIYEMQKDDGGFAVAPGHGSVKLPEGITVTNGDPFTAFNTSEFQSRGTASITQTITLTNRPGETADDENTRLVCIKTVGRVKIEKPSDGC